MTRRRALLAAFAVVAGVACSKRAAPREPTDARRVVSLAPSTTEALFAVGAGDRVVGRSTYCDYPQAAAELPAVGGVEPDIEAILELRPDLVVGLAGAAAARTEETLRGHGIPTWFPADASLADVDAMIVGIGGRTGAAARARELVAGIDARVSAVERAVGGLPRPRVLMAVGLAPVVVAGPGSFADELLRRAGATNVVTEGQPWQTVAFERIAELDPDFVLDAAGSGSGRGAGIDADAPGWKDLRAVRQGHVLRVRDDRVLRAGPRIAEGLVALAGMLHPGAELPLR